MTVQPLPAAVGPAPVMRYVEDQRDDSLSLTATARRLPSVLARTLRLAWHADRRALIGMLAAQVAAAVLAALALTTTTRLIAVTLTAVTAYGGTSPSPPPSTPPRPRPGG
ncbi:hypothetical protein ABT298_30170 [Streptomyces sp. NPDC001034]|uniref:hypothetical protein n=1 Tax=Streptomyces sp. NPDC001034 TaxID=3154375 RepID=UPI00332ADB5C